MKRARSFVLMGTLGLAACPADVELGTLRVRAWQPTVLATGEGDLLEDASEVEVVLRVDGVEQTLSLDDDLRAQELPAAGDGSSVQVTLRTVGDALPNALGRSGVTRLEPGNEAVTLTVLLAPPDAEHRLASTLPDARTGMAVCSAPSGRAWAVGGLLGGTLAGGSFLVDPTARAVTEGPALGELRAFAACVSDGALGVYLAGGCDESGVAVSGLVYSAAGDLSSSFEPVEDLPGAGCHTRLTRLDDGRLVALTSTHLVVYAPGADDVTAFPIPSRVGGGLVAFPGEGARVLVSGGFTDTSLTTPVAGSVLYTLGDDTVTDEVTLPRAFAAVTQDERGVVVVDGAHVSLVDAEGTVAPLHESAVPPGFSAASLVSLRDGRYALVRVDGSSVLVVGGSQSRSLPLAPPRPAAGVLSDAGGALLIFGGDVAGISTLVVE